MKPRLIILIVLALAMAGGTVVLIQSYLKKPTKSRTVAKKVQLTYVLVAKKSMPAGTFVKMVDLHWQSWPGEGISRAYLVRGKANILSIKGAVVRQGIFAGQPVTREMLVQPGDRGFLAAVLRPGMRAVSVPVNANSSVGGLVFPGDRVDLLLSHTIKVASPTGPRNQQITETVLTNLRVLAIDQKIADQKGKPSVGKTITFEVTPKQAEFVTVAQRVGRLSLSLRSLGRDEYKTNPGALAAYVKGNKKKTGLRIKTKVAAGRLKIGPKEKEGLSIAELLPLAKRGGSFTRDTSVSRVLGSRMEMGTQLQVVRGGQATMISVSAPGNSSSTGSKVGLTKGSAAKLIPRAGLKGVSNFFGGK